MPAAKKKTPRKKAESRKRRKTQALENRAHRQAGTPEVPLKVAPTPYRHGEPSSGPQPLEHCPACDTYQLLSAFALRPKEKMNTRGCFVCQGCRDTATKPKTDALAKVNPRDRQMLRDLMRTQSFAETAKLHGVTAETVRKHVNKSSPDDGFNAIARREAWKQMLVAEGLDAGTISRLLKLELYAVEAKWNSAKGDWDYFPDHKSRQSAIRWIARQIGLDAPTGGAQKQEAPGLSVTIVTSLGGDAPSKPSGSEPYTIDVTPE